MAHRQHTGMTTAVQTILTDDPDFPRRIVEWVVQEVLGAEMTAHLHAGSYECRAAPTDSAMATNLGSSTRAPAR